VTWTSSYPEVPVGGTTLHALVAAAAARHPDRTALVDGPSGASVSHAELARRVERIAAWLHADGVRPGSVLGLWVPNTPPWAALALAALRLGATVTAAHAAAPEREALGTLAAARADVVVTTPERVPAVPDRVRRVVVLGEAAGAVPLREVLACTAPAPAPADDPDAVALLPFSSGTTGRPKGVRLTHTNLVTQIRQMRAVLGLTEHDTTLALAPFPHVLGSVGTLALPLAVGATVVTVPRLDPALLGDLVERHRIRFLAVPPPVAAVLTAHPALAERDLSSLRLVGVGAAPFPPRLQEALAARLPGCVIGQGWGMTETTSGICLPDGRAGTAPGAVGRPLPNTELRVVDPTSGRDLGAGEVGELWVRGPQVMAGYQDDPEATAAILDADGWLRTGDLGRVGPGGDVVLVDRIKELIKVDGFPVAPAELEALLVEHPAVADAAVVGRSDERHGEVPVAYVVPRPGDGAAFDGEAVHRWLAQRVARHQRPAALTVVDTLPRSPAGKLLRRAL
jgi:acyl-CoA synthetase (AMP-forming)/AMP-acid ligase II